MSKWIAWLSAVLVLAMSATASAELPFSSVGSFATAPKDGLTSHHRHLAVRDGNGEILVANTVADRIDVYTPTSGGATLLTSFGTGTLVDPYGLAIDQSDGTVYVTDAGNSRIVKYSVDDAATPTFTRVNAPDFTSPAQGTAADQVDRFDAALAVGPDGDLWVADPGINRIKRFNADGSYAGAFIDGAGSPASTTTGLNGEFTGLRDLAVDSTGDVIALDQHGDMLGTSPDDVSRVERFASDGTWEASITGIVNPGAVAVYGDDRLAVSTDQNSYNSTALITVVIFAADGTVQQTLAMPTSGDGSGSPALYSVVTGIAIGAGPAYRTYVATDADPAGGIYGAISIQAYEVPQPAKPTLTPLAADAAYADANLSATVNPHLLATSYHVEYGTTDAYGLTTPTRIVAGQGLSPVAVKVSLEGLTPGVTYHARLVAGNALGETVGPDKSFTTKTRAGADGCANALFREAQHAGFLPECRAWEMVSPVDKNGGDAGSNVSYFGPSQISQSGDAAVFTSNDAYPGTESSSGAVYLSKRGSSGWSTRAVLPPIRQNTFFGNQNDLANFFSGDLSKTLVTSAASLTPDAPDGPNLYVRDNTTGTYRVVNNENPASSVFGVSAAGVSKDFRHVLVTSRSSLTPDAPAGAPWTIYTWAEGSPDEFQLAGRLPDGSFDPGGAQPGGWNAAGQGSVDHAMSDDGSRIFFNSPAGSSTVYVSENGGPATLISDAGEFWTATPSGSDALYLTGSGDLERYSLDHGTTTDLAPDLEPADGSSPDVEGVVGVSDDLSRVYFVAKGQLVAGKGVSGADNLYLWQDGGVRFIATLVTEDRQRGLWDDQGFPSTGQEAVTPDGRYLAFSSGARLTGDAGASGEVYFYDASAGTLTCPSCGDLPGDSTLHPTNGNTISSFRPLQRDQDNLSADGSRLYFQSSRALVPQDTNGVTDVYQWSGGSVHLISGGGGEGGGSQFMGTSPSGDEVFFTTRDRLVGQDKGTDNDVYVARIGGGFPEPVDPPQPCHGDGCRGLPTAPAAPPPAASVTFFGPLDATRVLRAKPTVAKPSTVRGAVGVLRVTVPGKGKLKLTGSGLRSVSTSRAKAGVVKVKVALTARAAATLRKRHRFTTTASVAFTPSGGVRSVARVRLTFRSPAKTAHSTHASTGRGR